MQLSQDTLLAILAAVLIADVLVVFIALIWTQVQKRRSDAASAAPVGAVAPRPVLSARGRWRRGRRPWRQRRFVPRCRHRPTPRPTA